MSTIVGGRHLYVLHTYYTTQIMARMCQVVLNRQLAASGHYDDVKYPKCVYTVLDTILQF